MFEVYVKKRDRGKKGRGGEEDQLGFRALM